MCKALFLFVDLHSIQPHESSKNPKPSIVFIQTGAMRADHVVGIARGRRTGVNRHSAASRLIDLELRRHVNSHCTRLHFEAVLDVNRTMN
jgi:hypothetical protein